MPLFYRYGSLAPSLSPSLSPSLPLLSPPSHIPMSNIFLPEFHIYIVSNSFLRKLRICIVILSFISGVILTA